MYIVISAIVAFILVSLFLKIKKKKKLNKNNNINTEDPKLNTIYIAYDTEVRSNTFDSNILNAKLQQSNINNIKSVNVSVNDIPKDALLVVTNKELFEVVKTRSPYATCISINNFVDDTLCEELINKLSNINSIEEFSNNFIDYEEQQLNSSNIIKERKTKIKKIESNNENIKIIDSGKKKTISSKKKDSDESNTVKASKKIDDKKLKNKEANNKKDIKSNLSIKKSAKEKVSISIKKSQIILGSQAKNREEAIRFVISKLVELGYVEDTYIKYVLKNEKYSSTYIGNGVATPHGTDDSKGYVIKDGIIICQYLNGVNYLGREKAHIVIGIASKTNNYQNIISYISKILKDEKKLNTLKASKKKQDFIDILI